MMRKNDGQRSREKGQSLTEFGVSVVILLVLLAGTVDAGRAFFTYMALRDAVQEAPSMAHTTRWMKRTS